MNEQIKEQVSKQVKERIAESVDIYHQSDEKMIGESFRNGLYQSILEMHDQEIAQEAYDNSEELITEGLVQSVLKKGLERYPMMFLERGDQRYFFVKSSKGVEWIYFLGQTISDRGVYDNDEAGEEFINARMEEGFKPIKRDGGIKKFFKAIGRGLATVMKVLGGLSVAGAILMVLVIALNPMGIMDLGYGVAGSMYGIQAIASGGVGLVTIGGGWLIGRISNKKADIGADENVR